VEVVRGGMPCRSYQAFARRVDRSAAIVTWISWARFTMRCTNARPNQDGMGRLAHRQLPQRDQRRSAVGLFHNPIGNRLTYAHAGALPVKRSDVVQTRPIESESLGRLHAMAHSTAQDRRGKVLRNR
jgi:hypothetical protein